MDRLSVLNQFYQIMNRLESRLSRKRLLKDSDGEMGWPKQGIYFFFENGEKRSNGSESRVVRVGTHAVSRGSKTILWSRLRTHRGSIGGPHAGGGNHRGSIFRLHVGTAIIKRKEWREKYPEWGKGSSAPKATREDEYDVEKLVSDHIRSMQFLWLKVEDAASKDSMRAVLERNAIALLSNFGRLGTGQEIDPPSPSWLGNDCEHCYVSQDCGM